MPKLNFHGRLEDDYEVDEDFDVDESYTGFEKIGKKKGEEDFGTPKKRSSIKHQKRPDKEV